MLARKLGVTPEYLETGSELAGAAAARAAARRAGAPPAARRRRPTPPRRYAILDEAEADADVGARSCARGSCSASLAAAARRPRWARSSTSRASLDSELVTPVSRPDVYSTLGHAYAARRARRARRSRSSSGRSRSSRRAEPGEPRGRGPLRDLPELRAHRPRRARARPRRARRALVALGAGSSDRYTRVRLYWSLGRVALEEAKPLAALDNFRRAVALLEATEDAVHLARAHVACAEAALGAGEELDGRARHLERGRARCCRARPRRADLAVVRRLQALRGAARRRRRRTPSRLGRAGARARERHPGRAGPRLVGARRGARAARRRPAADEAFAEALALLRAHGSGREHAERPARLRPLPARRGPRARGARGLRAAPPRPPRPRAASALERRGRARPRPAAADRLGAVLDAPSSRRAGPTRCASRRGTRATRPARFRDGVLTRDARARRAARAGAAWQRPDGRVCLRARERGRARAAALRARRSTTTTPSSCAASPTTRCSAAPIRQLRGLRPLRTATVAHALLRAARAAS